MFGWILNKDLYLCKNNDIKGVGGLLVLTTTIGVVTAGSSYYLLKYYFKCKNRKIT